MSTQEKVIQGTIGTVLVIWGTPNLKILGAAMIVGALTPDQAPPDVEADLLLGRQVTGTDPTGYRQVIYGQPRVGGVITYMALHGSAGQYLDLVVTLAGHQVEEIGTLYLNNEEVPLDGSGNATGKFAGYAHVEKRLGTTDQTVITGLRDATLPAWGDGIRLDGMGNYGATAATTAFNGATLTIECWVRPLAFQQGIIAALAAGVGWKLEMEADGAFRFTDGAGTTVATAAQALGAWIHVAVQASAAGMVILLDGVSAASTGTAFVNGGSGAQVLRVGSLDGAAEFLCADVDDFQVWDVVRSATEIQADGDAIDTGVVANRITGIGFYDGSGSTATDYESPAHNLTLFPSWTDNHRQRGCAYAWVRLAWNESLFSGGLPNITFLVKGKQVRDPRPSPDTTAWSQNAALIQADYLTDTDFGLHIAAAEIDDDLLAAAANLADEAVNLNDGASPPGTEPRYRIDGSFTVEKTPASILQELFTATQGYLSWVGGKWGIYGAAYRAPTITLTEADLRGTPTIDTVLATRDNFNAVKGVHPDPLNNWQPGEVPPVTNATYEAEDGGERKYLDTSYPLTLSAAACQRLGKIQLERTRQGIVVRWPGKLNCFRLQPADTAMVTWDVMGWSAKVFEVLEGQFVVDGDPPELGYDLVLRETAAGVYTWSQEEATVDVAPNSFLPNPFLVLAPLDLALESGTAALGIRADGTIFSRIHVTWTAPPDQYVQAGGRIEIQYRLSGQSPAPAWLPHDTVQGGVTESYILDVIDGTIYDVRIRASNAAGAASAWVTITGHTVIGKTAPPENVTGFTVQQTGNLAVFRWNAAGDLDLGGYEIRFGSTDAPWASALPIAVGGSTRISASSTVTNAAVPPSPKPVGSARLPWRFQIKAVDTSGNESAASAVFDLVVEPAYDAIFQRAQWPVWAGTLVNLIRNPLTGHLWVQSQWSTMAAFTATCATVTELFARLSANPYATATYTAPEIDTGGDDACNIWGEITVSLPEGETGLASASLYVDYRLAAGSYDGFAPWSLGEVTARFVKHQVLLDTADGAEVLEEFVAVVDLLEHGETATVAVAAGGTRVTYTRSYRIAPRTDRGSLSIDSATDGGSPATNLNPVVDSQSLDGFNVWILNGRGESVGGSATYTTNSI